MIPKILVTICNYNHLQYLRDSIESIRNQTYKNLDICIVDDSSVDKIAAAELVANVRRTDDRIRYIQNGKNMGKWFSLNRAIATTDAIIVTSHDADDVSLIDRIQRQYDCLIGTKTYHNLCGFYHCWNEEDVKKYANQRNLDSNLQAIAPEQVYEMIQTGYNTDGINHFFTGNFETAGVTAMFYKELWNRGLRFHPPGLGLRVLNSEDSDFNFRLASAYGKTSVLAEQLYCYRRNTSTNNEKK